MKALSKKEVLELQEYISKHHPPFSKVGKSVKYMDMGFDFRTNDTYYVKLRGFGSVNKEFHVGDQNGGRMIEEIYKYLKS